MAEAGPIPERVDFDALVAACYPQLRSIARQMLTKERVDHTLQATALVHEAWVTLRGSASLRINTPEHGLRILAHAMRRLLVSHAKNRKRLKRGGGWKKQSLDGIDASVLHEFGGWEGLDELDRALEVLERQDPQLVRIVEAKTFAELTDQEAAKALGIGVTTYKKRWTFARAWLHTRLDGRQQQQG